jgi:glycosyltransferase involved in cell wall biosynthesis
VYNESDIYVASQLADGFDLGSAEAMSSGLPVIVGGYGGQIEHVPDDCGFKLKYKLERVKEDPMYEEVSWGKPDLEDLKKRMRYAFEHQEEMKEMGKRAREFIVNNFTWDITANKATKFLEEEHGSK